MYNANSTTNYVIVFALITLLTISNEAKADFSYSNDNCIVYHFHSNDSAEYLVRKEPYYKDFSDFARYLTLRKKQKNNYESCKIINKNLEKIFSILPNISAEKIDKLILTGLAPEYNNFKDKYFLSNKFYMAAQEQNIQEMSEYLNKGANINFVPNGKTFNALSVSFNDKNARKFLLDNKIKIEDNYAYLAQIFKDNISTQGINLNELDFFIDQIGGNLQLNEVLSFVSNRCFKKNNKNYIYSKLSLKTDFSALGTKYSKYLGPNEN